MSYRLEPFHSLDARILDPVSSEFNFSPEALFKYRHTSADEDRWTQIIETDPKRAVSALSLYSSPKAKNEWGDTIADVHPLIQALEWVAKRGGKPWANVVKAGGIERLCKAVLEINTQAYLDDYPKMDHITLVQVLEARPPSYYLVLWVLFQAGKHMRRDPTMEPSRELQGALWRNWSHFMRRLWTEPDAKDPARVYGTNFSNRVGLASFLQAIIQVDSTFINVLIENSDLTLSVFTRYWTQAIKTGFLQTLSLTIHHVLENAHETILAPTPALIQKIMNGGDGTPTKIISRMVDYLRLVKFPEALPCFLLMSALYRQACREYHAADSRSSSAGRAFVRGVEQSQALWTTMFDVLGRASLPENDVPGVLVLEQDGDGSIGCSTPFQNSLLAPQVLDMTREVLVRVSVKGTQQEAAEFLRVLVRANFFGVLDSCVTRWYHAASLSPETLTRILCVVYDIRKSDEQDDWSILSRQLPRNRILRMLIRCAFNQDGNALNSDAPSLTALIKRHPHGTDWDPVQAFNRRLKAPGLRDDPLVWFGQNIWFAWYRLQDLCQINNQCTWRGCTEAGTARCRECHKARYCGAECQKRDWKEHRLICGFQMLGQASKNETVQKIVLPKKSLE